MFRFFRQKSTFFCFSPFVMVATFAIEIILALYIFARYRMTKFGRTAALLLALLATFQLAEYLICVGSPHALMWSRVGFVAITLLPLVGLYLVSQLSHKTHFLKLGYVAAILYAAYFLFVPKAITGAFCGGNYVIFNSSQALYGFYGFYYFGFLILGIWEALEKISAIHKPTITRKILFWFIAGYLSFILPMGVIFVISPDARNALASIMCGFAIIFALILAFKIVPKHLSSK
ncbi:MAG: hypothetical protein Q7S83_00375 [bacterium]|nr:hypothetical protein [bacterium]